MQNSAKVQLTIEGLTIHNPGDQVALVEIGDKAFMPQDTDPPPPTHRTAGDHLVKAKGQKKKKSDLVDKAALVSINLCKDRQHFKQYQSQDKSLNKAHMKSPLSANACKDRQHFKQASPTNKKTLHIMPNRNTLCTTFKLHNFRVAILWLQQRLHLLPLQLLLMNRLWVSQQILLITAGGVTGITTVPKDCIHSRQ